MRRIKQISIKNLFGIFNHTIQLHMDERVTIIHSPNGFGKTAILKLLSELFTQGTNVIRNTPFDEFHIYFEDNTHLWIEKKRAYFDLKGKNEDVSEKLTIPQILFYYADSKGSLISHLELPAPEITINHYYPRSFAQSLRLKQIEGESILNANPNEIYGIQRMGEEISFIEYEENDLVLQSKNPSQRKEDAWLQELRESISIRFIETQRLLNASSETKGQKARARSAMLPAVPLYSEELAKSITAKLADSTARSQELDRSFPGRLVELATRQSDISESELRAKLAELEVRRKGLMAVGLVDQNANDAVLTANRIDSSTKSVLSLYIEDTRQKLAVFDDIAPKIELLTRVINKRFLYKEMSVNRKDGFVFTTPKGTRLALENLSSGEQHELVLFYELLFKTIPGSLIMIDEPEISLHVVWQEHFLQDVQDITRLADVDVLIATHSPDIIDGRRDLVVELEGPEDGGL